MEMTSYISIMVSFTVVRLLAMNISVLFIELFTGLVIFSPFSVAKSILFFFARQTLRDN